MSKPIEVITVSAENEEVIRRLVTGVVQQWDRIPKHVQEDILRDATLANSAGAPTTSLREQVTAFIHQHAGDRP